MENKEMTKDEMLAKMDLLASCLESAADCASKGIAFGKDIDYYTGKQAAYAYAAQMVREWFNV